MTSIIKCTEESNSQPSASTSIVRVGRLSLFYEKGNDGCIYGYSDVDWAGNLDDKRSTNGYEFTLGHAMIS